MLAIKNTALLFIIFFLVSCQENKKESKSHSTQVSDLIHSDGTITDTVVEILGQAGVRIKGMPVKASWPTMVAELDSPHCENVKNLIQGKDPRYPKYSWRAKPGVEYWDMKDELKDVNILLLVDLILKSNVNELKGLNLAAATYPRSQTFSEFFLLGATLGNFKLRVNFLNELIAQDLIKMDSAKVYILTGKRPFNDVEKELLKQASTTESLKVLEMNSEKSGLEWVYNQTAKETSFSALPAITINDAEPKGVRASVEGAFALFCAQLTPSKEQWKDKRVLAVSTHVFAFYQYLTLKRAAVQNGFDGHIEMCAPALMHNESSPYSYPIKLTILLDVMSRIFYEICLYKNITGKYPS